MNRPGCHPASLAAITDAALVDDASQSLAAMTVSSPTVTFAPVFAGPAYPRSFSDASQQPTTILKSPKYKACKMKMQLWREANKNVTGMSEDMSLHSESVIEGGREAHLLCDERTSCDGDDDSAVDSGKNDVAVNIGIKNAEKDNTMLEWTEVGEEESVQTEESCIMTITIDAALESAKSQVEKSEVDEERHQDNASCRKNNRSMKLGKNENRDYDDKRYRTRTRSRSSVNSLNQAQMCFECEKASSVYSQTSESHDCNQLQEQAQFDSDCSQSFPSQDYQLLLRQELLRERNCRPRQSSRVDVDNSSGSSSPEQTLQNRRKPEPKLINRTTISDHPPPPSRCLPPPPPFFRRKEPRQEKDEEANWQKKNSGRKLPRRNARRHRSKGSSNKKSQNHGSDKNSHHSSSRGIVDSFNRAQMQLNNEDLFYVEVETMPKGFEPIQAAGSEVQQQQISSIDPGQRSSQASWRQDERLQLQKQSERPRQSGSCRPMSSSWFSTNLYFDHPSPKQAIQSQPGPHIGFHRSLSAPVPNCSSPQYEDYVPRTPAQPTTSPRWNSHMAKAIASDEPEVPIFSDEAAEKGDEVSTSSSHSSFSVVPSVRNANQAQLSFKRQGPTYSTNLHHNYDHKGRCIRHPHIRLRKKRAFDEGWKVLLSACPDCCLEELRRITSKEKDRTEGKSLEKSVWSGVSHRRPSIGNRGRTSPFNSSKMTSPLTTRQGRSPVGKICSFRTDDTESLTASSSGSGSEQTEKYAQIFFQDTNEVIEKLEKSRPDLERQTKSKKSRSNSKERHRERQPHSQRPRVKWSVTRAVPPGIHRECAEWRNGLYHRGNDSSKMRKGGGGNSRSGSRARSGRRSGSRSRTAGERRRPTF